MKMFLYFTFELFQEVLVVIVTIVITAAVPAASADEI
jgi:hypothetical protein